MLTIIVINFEIQLRITGEFGTFYNLKCITLIMHQLKQLVCFTYFHNKIVKNIKIKYFIQLWSSMKIGETL